jgi:hypothetical protein
MFGYERSEMVDQSIEMLVPENVRERQIFPVLCASFCRR